MKGRSTTEASAGGSLEAKRGGEDLKNYTVKGDRILIYRFRWLGEREMQVESVNHGKAGFMNHSEDFEDEGIDVAEVTAQEAQYFAQHEEYNGVEETSLTDDKESWTLLSISD